MFLDIAGKNWNGEQIVRRNVKKSLDLSGMQIKCQNAVGPSFGDQVGNEFR